MKKSLQRILLKPFPGIFGEIGRIFALIVYAIAVFFVAAFFVLYAVIADSFVGRAILLTFGYAGSVFRLVVRF